MERDRGCIWLLLGCPAIAADAPEPAAPGERPVGTDRDAHGCIATAGYVWCARGARCVRPWELAAARGLAPGEEAFSAYCAEPDR